MRNDSDRIKTHLCSMTFFFENRAVYEIMKKKCAAGLATCDNIRGLNF